MDSWFTDSDNMDIEHNYTRETFTGTIIEVIYRKWIQKRILIVDFNLKPKEIQGSDTLRRKEVWTKTPKEELHAKGYREAVGLHDSLLWWKVPILAKVNNGTVFPIAEFYPEKKDTAYTINNAALSRAKERFKKAMARAQLTMAADWQKLGLIAILGVGVIIATKWFGIW